MSFIVAKRSIDYFMTDHYFNIRRINPAKRVAIGFYGGEPLMEYDLITKIKKYCNDKYPNVNIMWNITINGTLIPLQ
jgi:uncharacterized protein